MDLPGLYHAVKQLSVAPQWVTRADKPEWLRMLVPLDIDGVTIQGLQLRGTAIAALPDKAVTFQLEYLPSGPRAKGGAMCRIEWRPISAHNNRQRGPAHLRNVVQRGSHHHSFELNWQHAPLQVQKGNPLLSEPIAEDIPTFEALLAFMGNAFRITNVASIPVPGWEDFLL